MRIPNIPAQCTGRYSGLDCSWYSRQSSDLTVSYYNFLGSESYSGETSAVKLVVCSGNLRIQTDFTQVLTHLTITGLPICCF